MKEVKFKMCDKVKIINYGAWAFVTKEENKAMNKYFGYSENRPPENIIFEDDKTYTYDWQPELVGRECVINEVIETQGMMKYGLTFLDGNTRAWFSKNQLELIK